MKWCGRGVVQSFVVLVLLAPGTAFAQVDLVSSISSATLSPATRTVTFNIVVCNNGSAAAGAFTVGLWYSRATAPTCTDTPDATSSVAGLAAGQCSTLSLQRASTPDGSYTAWALADSTCQVTETNEGNNASTRDYQVRPDLRVFNLTATVSGTSVTYSGIIYNVGVSATAFTVGLYHNRTSAPTCADPPDFTWSVAGLNYNAFLTLPAHVQPGVPTGTYRAWILVDNACAVTESNETNNTASRFYSVGPNLRVFTPAVSVSGSTVNYQVAVCNQGTVASGAFSVSLWYSRATAPACNSAGADHTWSVPGLAPGACTILTHIRTNAQGGSYTSWAFADPTCTLVEYNETDNIAFRTFSVPAPNFYISSFSATVSGSQVTFAATVCNSGASTSLPFNVGLVHTSPTAPTCSSPFDFTWPAISGLATGACITLTPHVLTSVPVGNYQAWARADSGCTVNESNETNNNASASYAIAPTSPDLYVSTFTAAVSGSTVIYTAQVCNAGITTSGTVGVGLYFNRTTAPACGNAPDTTVTTTGAIAAGGCATVSYTRTATPPGSYTGWAFADATCAITEYNEGNNTKSAAYTVAPPLQPNLRVTTLTVTSAGSTVTYTATVCNQGTGASAASTVGLWYNRTAAPSNTCVDAPDVTAAVGALAAAACETKTWTQNNVGPGSYTAWTLADSACVVTEGTETDNTRSQAYTVIALPPDTGVTVDGAAKEGGVLPDTGPKPDGVKPADGPNQIEGPVAGDGAKPKVDGKPVSGEGVPNPDAAPAGDGQPVGDGAISADKGPPAQPPSSGCCRVSQAQTADLSGTAFLTLIGVVLLLISRRRRRRS